MTIFAAVMNFWSQSSNNFLSVKKFNERYASDKIHCWYFHFILDFRDGYRYTGRGTSASVEDEAKAGDVTVELEVNVTDVDVEEMAQDDDTNTLREDVLVETEDENNMNVREVLELEDEMAQDDMNTSRKEKRKDVFEETAEVEKNVSDVQEQEVVSSSSSKKVKGNIVILNHFI